MKSFFNTTINQRHFHDPFYSLAIDQNIIFGQKGKKY